MLVLILTATLWTAGSRSRILLVLFYFWLNCGAWKVKVKLAQLCPTLCDPMDPMNCGAYGILIPWPGIEPVPSALGAQNLNHSTMREGLRLILKMKGLRHWEGKELPKATWLLIVSGRAGPWSQAVWGALIPYGLAANLLHLQTVVGQTSRIPRALEYLPHIPTK